MIPHLILFPHSTSDVPGPPAPAPPPPPPSGMPTPSPRKRTVTPSSGTGGGRGALLAGIQKGVRLKKVKESEKKDRSEAVSHDDQPSAPANPMAAALMRNPRFKQIQKANGH